MSGDAEVKVKKDLYGEINLLEESFRQLTDGLSAKNYDALAVASALKTFRDSLSRASAFALTLYTLRGKQINISWNHLFTHLDYGITTIQTLPALKQRAALQAILALSKAEFDQILTYFGTLKKSIT